MDIDKKIEEAKNKIKIVQEKIIEIKQQIQILNNQGQALDNEILKLLGSIEAYQSLLKPISECKNIGGKDGENGEV